MEINTQVWQYIVVAILIVVSAICKGIQDTLQFHFETSVFKNLGDYWNPLKSWKRKYKNGDPKQGEAFLGSTSIFVSLTDAWHLFGLIRDFSVITIAISIASLNPWFLLGYIIYFSAFHVMFTWILRKK